MPGEPASKSSGIEAVDVVVVVTVACSPTADEGWGPSVDKAKDHVQEENSCWRRIPSTERGA